ncbi:MAG TPA: sugar kinase, partial [Candidatus Krumholzibacteria bacterium]
MKGPRRMEIVVVGSIALDTIETPWGKAEDALGGSATYASIAASYFAPVKIVGICGDDLDEKAHQMWRDRDVDTKGLQIVKGGETFRWGGRYHQDMNRRDTLFTHLNVFEHFHPQLPESYRDAAIVLLANIH